MNFYKYDMGRAMRGKMITVEVNELHPTPPKEVVIRMSPAEARHLHKRLYQIPIHCDLPEENDAIGRLMEALRRSGIHTA